MMGWVALAVVVAGAGALLWTLRIELGRWIQEQIRVSLREAQEIFLTVAEQRLNTTRAQQLGDLDLRKNEVEKMVQGLEQQLGRYERLMRDFEQDRERKYGSLERQLTSAVSETQRLSQTTAQLSSMLGNARVRGQWGEKTADDILRLCGLQEGLHYSKQRNAPVGRPDFTFFLPDQHQFYMDVKFPLDNYVRMINSGGREEDARAYREQFLKDVRNHMKELERRDYAPSGSGEPDLVLLFIPNEQVYGAVNEWMPGLLDEGMAKRIVLCGPWTLYAQVRVISQAWQNYYHAQAIGEIAKTVHEFLKDYERFKDRFKELGERLEKVSEKYQEITQASYAQLDRKITRIKDYQRGQGLASSIGLEEEPLASVPLKEVGHD